MNRDCEGMRGPCACGAWHDEGEAKELQRQLRHGHPMIKSAVEIAKETIKKWEYSESLPHEQWVEHSPLFVMEEEALLLAQAVIEAEKVIRDWVHVTDQPPFKHPWNGSGRDWLAKFSGEAITSSASAGEETTKPEDEQ